MPVHPRRLFETKLAPRGCQKSSFQHIYYIWWGSIIRRFGFVKKGFFGIVGQLNLKASVCISIEPCTSVVWFSAKSIFSRCHQTINRVLSICEVTRLTRSSALTQLWRFHNFRYFIRRFCLNYITIIVNFKKSYVHYLKVRHKNQLHIIFILLRKIRTMFSLILSKINYWGVLKLLKNLQCVMIQ